MLTKILLLVFVLSFLIRSDLSFDQDLGRHLKLGEIITQTHTVPKVNLFSYTNPNFPFINTHWLFEVLVFMGSNSLGLYTLLILKVAIILISVWLTLKIIARNNSALLLPVGFIFLHVLRERTDLRPEIFSFLFTALTFYILDKYEKFGTKLIFSLPLIQLIWVNTHIYFPIGLILQAIFLIHIGLTHLRFHPRGGKLRMLGIVFVLSVIASLINPHFLKGFLYPLNVFDNYGYTIVENQTMFLLENIGFSDHNFLFVKLAGVIILFSIVVSIIRRHINLKSILLSLLGLGLALGNVRSFPFLVLISLPAALINFGPIKPSLWTKILSFITVTLLIGESWFYLNGSYYTQTDSQYRPGLAFEQNAKGALDLVLSQKILGPIYNNFDIGSYIIYRGYPNYRVFIDGRPEAYPKEFFQQVYIPSQYDYQKFEDLEQKYNFQTVIFSHTDQTPWGKAFLQSITHDNTWKTVYLDDTMIVLAKNPSPALKGVDLTSLDPTQYQFLNHVSYLRMGIFLISTGYTQSGQKFILKSLQLNPQSPLANLLMANIEASKGDFLNRIEASKYQQKAKNLFFW